MQAIGTFVAYIMRNDTSIRGFRAHEGRVKIYFSTGEVRTAYVLDRVLDNDDYVFIKYNDTIYQGKYSWSSGDWTPLCKAYA